MAFFINLCFDSGAPTKQLAAPRQIHYSLTTQAMRQYFFLTGGATSLIWSKPMPFVRARKQEAIFLLVSIIIWPWHLYIWSPVWLLLSPKYLLKQCSATYEWYLKTSCSFLGKDAIIHAHKLSKSTIHRHNHWSGLGAQQSSESESVFFHVSSQFCASLVECYS